MSRLLVLLGANVQHSLSPAIHNAACEATSVDAVYIACDVTPEALPDAVRGLHALGASGANVTIPHKQAVLTMAESLSPEAEAVGAANTLVRTETGWHAHNTDVEGFLAPLAEMDLHGAEMTVLGAGGAARAVVYALLTAFAPSRLTVASRRVGQADALANALTPHDARGALQTVPLAEAPEGRLVVNCTPLGMVGMEDLTPFASGAIGRGQIAYDLVYRPAQTRFLRDAQTHGAETIPGLPMLIGQAAASFRLWAGHEMPTDIARRAALDALAQADP